MARVRKPLRITWVFLFVVIFTACEVLPVDLLPKPPTLFPGASATILPTVNIDKATPTAPGFPTQPGFETPIFPEITPTIDQPEVLPPIENSPPLAPTLTPRPEPFFVLQPGNPIPLENFLKPDLGCNWMGVGGQIFDLQGLPMTNYLIQIEGELDSGKISLLALTGGTPQLGPGGYLLEIASHPIESSGKLYLQVLDLAGRVLSDKVFITTYSECEKNFILLNFSQTLVNMNNTIYLPSITRE